MTTIIIGYENKEYEKDANHHAEVIQSKLKHVFCPPNFMLSLYTTAVDEQFFGMCCTVGVLSLPIDFQVILFTCAPKYV